MTISLDKLLFYNGNKYILTKAAMKTVEKIGNLKEYQEDVDEKIVINTLNYILDGKVKFEYLPDKEIETD